MELMDEGFYAGFKHRMKRKEIFDFETEDRVLNPRYVSERMATQFGGLKISPKRSKISTDQFNPFDLNNFKGQLKTESLIDENEVKRTSRITKVPEFIYDSQESSIKEITVYKGLLNDKGYAYRFFPKFPLLMKPSELVSKEIVIYKSPEEILFGKILKKEELQSEGNVIMAEESEDEEVIEEIDADDHREYMIIS